MKKSRFYSGLLVTPLPLSLSCSSLSSTLSTAQAQNQASLSATSEKMRRLHGWQFDNLALLKAIKNNATRFLHHHHPDKKIIRLEDWRE